jgi:hypothetical protein
MASDALKELRDDIAATEALIDQAQAHYNEHKHLWTEEQAWHIQAEIDTKRFALEANKTIVKMLSSM